MLKYNVLKLLLGNFLRESDGRNHRNDSRCNVFFERSNGHNPATVAHSLDANHHQKKPADLIKPDLYPKKGWKKYLEEKYEEENEEIE